MFPDSANASTRGAAENSLGRANFVALIGLDSPERQDLLAHVPGRIDEEKPEVVRVAFVDTHGIVRARPIEARPFAQAARNGMPFTTAFFALRESDDGFSAL